jgi:hypothetical protein
MAAPYAKAGGKAVQYGGKFALNAYKRVTNFFSAARTTKVAMETKTVVKLTRDAMPKIQRVSRTTENISLPKFNKPSIAEKTTFPNNPKDFLPNAYRDKKGYIYASDKIRIKPEKHSIQSTDMYNPRHHDQHYHVEVRLDTSRSWNRKESNYYLKPNDYSKGSGTGFLPGENFPGSWVLK